MEKIFEKGFSMKVLNGVAIGTVAVLIPGALLNELFTALLPVFPQGQFILTATALATTLMGVVVGVMVSIMFKFTPIHTAAVAIASGLGSGAWSVNESGQFIVQGSGDIINMSLTATIAVIIILACGNRFRAYTMLVVPALTLVVAGGLGVAILPYVKSITSGIAEIVRTFLDLQPILMSFLMAIVFSIMIVSPISTVGIALAINLSGVGSGAANVGVCAAAFGLAISGWKTNELGTSIALIMGSPKMAMPNVIKNPKIMLPIIINAAISGIICALFQQQGTSYSAGFGFSGLIGPLNAIRMAGGFTPINIFKAVFVFVGVPVVLAFIMRYVFMHTRKLVNAEDYRIDVK
ncbi:hypothetical protein AOC36_03655 [Erysipelothrix larvae]|uniref:Phosphotransferase system EIIC domain-containing protein n=1 Tax=Erysipelothrix larvae TaxID=1514105 RepID=A0A109UGR7_9FIRM|nr:PTS sugar transporter subunit IIC [Erysipelothrix larvae]AMC93103.1 hypothetical protein AOC36_03655 [Erysipelothrix larvae]